MLNIQTLGFLADRLSVSQTELVHVADSAESFYQRLQLIDPAKPDKIRTVRSVQGKLRMIQERLLRRVFMARLQPSPYAHGGVRGRNIKSNASMHLQSAFVFTSDVANFFPSINNYVVYRLFRRRLACSPDVSRILTLLCTTDGHLALGLVTSPFLAEQVFAPIDARIFGACKSADLIYTRYVDDITVSGRFDLEASGFLGTLTDILERYHFTLHKERFGRIAEGAEITSVTLCNGHPDVPRDFLLELHRQLDDAACLARGDSVAGPYYTRSQIAGRVYFASWLNPRRKKNLMRRLNSVNWAKVECEATKQGLVAAKKRLIPTLPISY